jgi:uncharacterized iron-regulated membrane protein
VLLGAAIAFLALTGVGAWLQDRRGRPRRRARLAAARRARHRAAQPRRGLRIGTAYATGALALGAFLVVGFACTTRPRGSRSSRRSRARRRRRGGSPRSG